MKKKSNTFINLYTEAGEEIKTQEKVWKEYPRPQLEREFWQSLNGIWNLDQKAIRVPFVPQSVLSEYEGEIQDRMCYTKVFHVESFDDKKRTLLHFQAVDQIAEVYLNGIFLGKHEGGYHPFSFDVSEVIKERENHLSVKVTDCLDLDYPYGKQSKKRGGMWYTPTSGIWQSVWLEQVPDKYITDVKIIPDLKGIQLKVKQNCECSFGMRVVIFLDSGEEYSITVPKQECYIDLSEIVHANGERYIPRLWNTEDPYLYKIVIQTDTDKISSYFALRTIEIQSVKGIRRVCLNHEPVFMHGVLDQGYYSDGIVLPARQEEYEKDILRMKALGFNMLRKHIKVEPECFYYFCDKHGMLVVQDMVNSGKYSFFKDTVLPTIGLHTIKERTKERSLKQRENFEKHMLETILLLHNHPCIVAYTIFNEGWGQFESDRLYELAKETDSTRLYDATSGWFAQEKSDFDSIHIYFGNKKPEYKQRPVFLSEFGGYSYMEEGHIFSRKNYGYGTCKSTDEFMRRIEERYEELVLPYVETGLCGSVYTQLSDVEDEINGFYTYDRKVCKADKKAMNDLAEKIMKKIQT